MTRAEAFLVKEIPLRNYPAKRPTKVSALIVISLIQGVWFFLAISLLSLPAFADEDDLNFVTLSHPPYGFLSSQGEKKGYLFEIANLIMAEAGFRGSNDIIPTLRVFHELENGDADCSILARVPIPEARYEKVAPIGHSIQIAIIPKKPRNLNRYEDLQGVRIGVPRGVHVGEPFDSDMTLDKVPTKGYKFSSIMFKNGRVDAVVGAQDSMLYNLDRVAVDRSTLGKALVLSAFPMWVMCQPGKVSVEQKSRLLAAARKLRSEGVINNTINRYLKSGPSS